MRLVHPTETHIELNARELRYLLVIVARYNIGKGSMIGTKRHKPIGFSAELEFLLSQEVTLPEGWDA